MVRITGPVSPTKASSRTACSRNKFDARLRVNPGEVPVTHSDETITGPTYVHSKTTKSIALVWIFVQKIGQNYITYKNLSNLNIQLHLNKVFCYIVDKLLYLQTKIKFILLYVKFKKLYCITNKTSRKKLSEKIEYIISIDKYIIVYIHFIGCNMHFQATLILEATSI